MLWRNRLKRRLAWLWLTVGCVVLGCARGAWADGQRVALQTAGVVDSQWIERVVAFARENTRLDIQTTEPLQGDFSSLNDVIDAARAKLGENDAFVVVLSGINTGETAHGVSMNDLRVAVINVPALMVDDPDEEHAGRRIERQVMQAIGILLGMSACPNPQCVLWPYSNMEELDAKGRNLCPPCYDQLQNKAAGQGLQLMELAVEEEWDAETESMPQPE